MYSAALQLQSHGVTMAVAHDWVMSHLDDPLLISQVASQYGVTNGMLAEIAGSPITAQQVVEFFSAHGIDSSALDAASVRLDLAPKEFDLGGMLALNDATGMLSTSALRADVQAVTGSVLYAELFSPNRVAGAIDGLLSPAETGSDALGTLPATTQTMESLFYGTMARMIAAIDADELANIEAFVGKYSMQLESGNASALADYELLVGKALQTPASTPLSQDAVRDLIVDAAASAVHLADTASIELLVPLIKFDI